MAHEAHGYRLQLGELFDAEIYRVNLAPYVGALAAVKDRPDKEEPTEPVEGLRIVVNEGRVKEVLGAIMAAYDAQDFPYNLDAVRIPHDPRHMPTTLVRGGVDHAMFMWTICYYMRGGIKSTTAVSALSRVYDDSPELFRCNEVIGRDQADLAALLKSYGLAYQSGIISQHWIENAHRLLDRYNGDPRNIFSGVSDYQTSQQRVQNDGRGGGFMGFQEKMTSMILYYLMDEGLIVPFAFPVPTDLHVSRISIANRLIEFPDASFGTNLYTPEVLSVLREVYFNYALENNINPLRLCDAVWLLSGALCSIQPGNKTYEPNGSNLRDGRQTILVPHRVDPLRASDIAAYNRSCGRCPIEELCEYNVPSVQYYVKGALIIRGVRVRITPPNTLFD